MKPKKYTFTFMGGKITTSALTYEAAEILAKAEAINRGWDYTIISENKEKVYRIYYKSLGEYQPTEEVFDNEFDANQRCFWLNENTIGSIFGTYVYKVEDK
jgi:hypothetical protein